MPRLKSVKPKLQSLRPRIRSGSFQDEAERSRHRRETRPSRAWYNTKRWKLLREEIGDSVGWKCQKTGVLLIGKAPAANSPVLDHIVPHRDDPELFWDRSNLQLVSKQWHDTVKQRQERAGLA